MTTISLYRSTILVFCLMVQISNYSKTIASKPISFSTNLIHRDSLQPSSYNRNVNYTVLLARTMSHSRARLSYLKSILNLPMNHAKDITNLESTVTESSDSYLMEIYVGTPPTKQMMNVGTASDISWIQCLPCEHCFEQNQPIFNSNESSTYKELEYNSRDCLNLGSRRVQSNGKCKYRLSYKDNSASYGELAKETYIVGGKVIRNMAHGCGHNNVGGFNEHSTGMIGLGDGPVSFVGQVKSMTGGMFSYCLVSNPNARSRIIFGDNPAASGRGVVYTPMLKESGNPFYYLTLKSISVENINIPFTRESPNIMIDSGTVLNYFPPNVLRNLKNALISVIRRTPMEDIDNELCFQTADYPQIPNIIFHFDNRANLVLSKKHTFSVYESAICLNMKADNDISVLGNRAQIDFMIGYNLPEAMISFKPADCSGYAD